MVPLTEHRDPNNNCSSSFVQQSLVRTTAEQHRVKRSVKFDHMVEFSDKAVGKLAPEEKDDGDAKADRIRARELRHRLRREWSSSEIEAPPESSGSSPAPPVRKRSVGYEAKVKDRTAPMCPQRKRSIGLTKDNLPHPYRSS